MNIYRFIKEYIQNKTSSSRGRLIVAFLMVMGFLCVFSGNITANASFQYKPVEARIAFDCKKIDGMDDNVYQISIKSDDANAPVPKNDTVIVNDSGKGEFVLTLTEPGTYEYLLYQVKGSDEKISYDETQYDVYVLVESDENGVLTYMVSVTIADTDDKPENVIFQNDNVGSDNVTPPDDTPSKDENPVDPPSTPNPPEDKESKVDPPSDKSSTNDKPQEKQATILTGDNAQILLAAIIAIAALGGIAVTACMKKKKPADIQQ